MYGTNEKKIIISKYQWLSKKKKQTAAMPITIIYFLEKICFECRTVTAQYTFRQNWNKNEKKLLHGTIEHSSPVIKRNSVIFLVLPLSNGFHQLKTYDTPKWHSWASLAFSLQLVKMLLRLFWMYTNRICSLWKTFHRCGHEASHSMRYFTLLCCAS